MAFEQRPLFDQQHPADNAHITEITLSSQAQLSRTLLSAMLGQLCGNTDPRWLCWVADRPVKRHSPSVPKRAQGDPWGPPCMGPGPSNFPASPH